MAADRELEENSGKGGLKTMPFIFVNESFERVATYGLGANQIIFMMQYYQMSAAQVNTFFGISGSFASFMAIVGAMVSDSWLGRFKVVAIGSICSFTGLLMMWLTTMIPQLTSGPCSQLQNVCNRTTAIQFAFLSAASAFSAVGTGFIRTCSIIFGADQLENKDDTNNQRVIDSYFNWYYASTGVATTIAVTVIAYIQEHFGWKLGFGIPALLMFISLFVFFIGSPLYVKVKAKGRLFIGLVQAAVAAFWKRNTNLQSVHPGDWYHQPLESELVTPSNDLRCLNKACLIQDPQKDLKPDGSALNPWSLCSVENLESLKAFVRVLPIWSTGFMLFLTTSQFSFSVLQVDTMDRHFIFPDFELPAASFSAFMILGLTLWLVFYERAVVPVLSNYFGMPRGLSPVTRMGIGLILCSVSMAMSGITESIRRQKAIEQGLEDDPSALVNMSSMWFVPQYALLGVADAIFSVGQIEVLYAMFPKTMSSIASAMYTVASAVSGLIVSALVSGVDWLTSTGGKTSWLSSNINKGHLDYYFGLIAFLCVLNFFYFLAVLQYYKSSDAASMLFHETEDKHDYSILPEA